jgi:hypothetical protein
LKAGKNKAAVLAPPSTGPAFLPILNHFFLPASLQALVQGFLAFLKVKAIENKAL